MTSDLKILETLIDLTDLEQRKVMTLDEKLEDAANFGQQAQLLAQRDKAVARAAAFLEATQTINALIKKGQ
jgi:hypothetical protein